MTVHAQSTRNPSKPVCKQFSYRWHGYAATTTNHAEVDCKACAKSLGITPAEKKITSAEGTCQCCFNVQKLPKGKLSHHGYQAPGRGYHIGQCRGQHHVPFELSCELTKTWRTEVEKWVEGRREYLAKLEAGEIKELTYVVVDYDAERNRYTGKRDTKLVKVVEGYEPPPYMQRTTKNEDRSWADALRIEIREVRANIEGGKEQIAYLTKKIGEWKLMQFNKETLKWEAAQ